MQARTSKEHDARHGHGLGTWAQELAGSDPAATQVFLLLCPLSRNRRRTNVQQLTCNIDLSCSFYHLFFSFVGSKKNNKQKTHKHFSDGPCGTIVPGTNPHPSQGQTGQNSDFTVELNRERPVCPRDRSHFVPGRGPICPRDGSCLSRRPSRRKCLCLLVFFLPDFVLLELKPFVLKGKILGEKF